MNKNKTVWILNHYAGNMFITGGGRHYFISKYLKEKGFSPVVFCSNFDHFTRNNCIETEAIWTETIEPKTDVPFVFLKTRKYSGNGIQRVLNMVDYYRAVLAIADKYAKEKGFPSVIYASSVHPLALVAGIKIAKRFGIKCISEVRDLWPESIVAYSPRWKKNNPVIKILYAGEKWIYKKSNYVIMTWAGGYDYIKDQGWQSEIPEEKVFFISNGVDLTSYALNICEHPFENADLSNDGFKTFIYTGSIRKVNNLGLLVSSAEKLKEIGNSKARILVFGDGDELKELQKEVNEKQLDNILFEGRIPKQCVPSVLSQGFVSILHNTSTTLNKYGQSQNKFFEYLAAGRPILMTYPVGHSVIEEYECGIELKCQTPELIAEAITAFCELSEERYLQYCNNAKNCSKQFDYKALCDQVIHVIEQCN